MECEVCHAMGSCQCFYNSSGALKYARIRHYDKFTEGKPKCLYHAQSLSYVSEQIEKQNQQNLSRGEEVNIVSGSTKQAIMASWSRQCNQYRPKTQ